MARWRVVLLILLIGCAWEEPDNNDGNQRPSPPLVTGPDEGYPGERLEFTVSVYDPDGGRLRVFVAWGDGDTSDYGDFVYSGETVLFEHSYARADTFLIRARCHDLEPLFSDWSTPRRVVIVQPPEQGP
ncbi:MAG: hypothetical protein ABIK44_02040 [candidate division WOR-3 bacterium]